MTGGGGGSDNIQHCLRGMDLGVMPGCLHAYM